MRKLIKKSRFILLIFGAFVASLLVIGQANAATTVFEYEVSFGAIDPAGPTPYLTATFDDADFGTGFDVRLTIFGANLNPTIESATELYFNLNPLLDSSYLTFSAVNTTDIDSNWTVANIITGNDSQPADGDGLYDILFDLPPPRGQFANRFTAGETLVFDISYSGVETLDASSFSFFSTPQGGQGTFMAAAHIQNIDGNGDGATGSGFVGVVPEPVSSTLFLVGAATLGFRRLRRNRKG